LRPITNRRFPDGLFDPSANAPGRGLVLTELRAPAERDIILGVILRTIAVIGLAAVSAGAKWMAAAGAPLMQIIFCRNIFAFIPILIMVQTTVGFGALKTRRPLRHLTRSIIGLLAMICTFMSVARLPLVEAATLGFTAPLFATVLSLVVLKEAVGWRRWLAVMVGFGGVLVALRPGVIQISIGVVYGLTAAALTAGAMISIRGMPKSEAGPTIAFYFTLACTVVSACSLPFGWIKPDLPLLLVMIGTGLAGGAAQLLLTTAVRLAPLPVLAPFDYTQLVWASGLGFLVWGERPDIWVLAGAGIIAASGIYILWRERTAARSVLAD